MKINELNGWALVEHLLKIWPWEEALDQEFSVVLAFTTAISRSKLRLHTSKIVVAVIVE
jgi:hypothetical protein